MRKVFWKAVYVNGKDDENMARIRAEVDATLRRLHLTYPEIIDHDEDWECEDEEGNELTVPTPD